MGGMGFIESNKAALHALGADQHPHAHRRPRCRRRALLLLLLGLRLRRRQADRPNVIRAEGGGCLPGDARGRLRLGEALQRADVPPLPRGLRPGDPGRPLPQRLRPARHLDGGREKAPAAICRKVIEAQLTRRRTRSRSGATASRPAASCTSTTASHGTLTIIDERHASSRSISAAPSWSRSTSSSTSSRISPASSCERSYNLDAPQGVRGRNSDNTLIQRDSAGSRPSRSARGWRDLSLDLRHHVRSGTHRAGQILRLATATVIIGGSRCCLGPM